MVRTLPAAQQLRHHYAEAHIAWLVERKAAGALCDHPGLDEILVFPREELTRALARARPLALARELGRFVRDLRARRFDLVVDFHGILKTGALSFASGAPVRVGYARPTARELSWLFATHTALLSPERVSRFERNAALVHFLGLDPVAPARSPMPVDAAVRERMRRALGSASPIAIHPGSSAGAPYKRYPAKRFAAVARALAAEDGIPSIVTWGPGSGERERALEVVAAAGEAARLAPETRALGDLAALLSLCRLFVGNDSGPLHVASLVGTPVVQVLGPTDPIENTPYAGTPSRSVREPLPCSPCRRGCAAATCMHAVQPGQVVSAARDLMAGSGGRPVVATGAP